MTLTPEQVREKFDREGISIADFARENDLDEHTVYQVLSGRQKGRRGKAHKAAVLLGLKDGVVNHENKNPTAGITDDAVAHRTRGGAKPARG